MVTVTWLEPAIFGDEPVELTRLPAKVTQGVL